MTSQPGQQTITIHILPNISQSKGNQILKLGWSGDIKTEIFFLKNHAENTAGRLV